MCVCVCVCPSLSVGVCVWAAVICSVLAEGRGEEDTEAHNMSRPVDFRGPGNDRFG